MNIDLGNEHLKFVFVSGFKIYFFFILQHLYVATSDLDGSDVTPDSNQTSASSSENPEPSTSSDNPKPSTSSTEIPDSLLSGSGVDVDEDYVDKACIICHVEQMSLVFLPCRHACVCDTCFLKLDKCPMCRSGIDSYFRLDGQIMDEWMDEEDEDSGWWTKINNTLNDSFAPFMHTS